MRLLALLLAAAAPLAGCGKAIGAGIDAMSSDPPPDDGSGIVIRERIRPETPDAPVNQ